MEKREMGPGDKLRRAVGMLEAATRQLREALEGMPGMEAMEGIEEKRERVVAYLDYLAAAHGGDDEYTAGALKVDPRSIRDEWRVKGKGRSLPSDSHMSALESLCLEEVLRQERKRKG